VGEAAAGQLEVITGRIRLLEHQAEATMEALDSLRRERDQSVDSHLEMKLAVALRRLKEDLEN
jgi:hypothetical protein